MKYPPSLQRLIDSLRRLPGVGAKTAERFAFDLLDWPPAERLEFARIVQEIGETLSPCLECGCLCENGTCQFCIPAREGSGCLCVISTPKDAYAIEGTREYRGLYHVLGGLLSPILGKGPESLRIPALMQRIERLAIGEVILALDSTVEGDATALYLKKKFADLPVRVSRLAFGIPIGSSFDYVDGGTLARALSGRAAF